MKYYLLCIIIAFAIQAHGQSYTNKKGDVHLWGETNLEALKEGPYGEWYIKNSKDFSPKISKSVANKLKGTKVKIFIGTWCGDTKYLVPKFVKYWEEMGLDTKQLEFIALHNEDELYKQGPNQETIGYNIHRVPTFVFEHGGEEIGRIVERTVFDLETDVRNIAEGLPYHQRYRGVTLLDEFFDTIPQDSISTDGTINKAYKKVYRELSGPGELNTYGYVLLAQDKLEEAKLVFHINSHRYKFDPNLKDSFGESLMKLQKYERAKEQYMESLRIDPTNENAISKLAELNELLSEDKT